MDVVTPHTLKIPGSPDSECLPLNHYYQNILICLGYASESPPVADLLRRLHGLQGSWLVVSPICWEASHNDAKLMAVDAELALSEEEARAWFDAFIGFAQQDITGSYYHDRYTWLICVDKHTDISAQPVQYLRHKCLLPHLTQLDNTSFWQRFLTEAQMFLSQHPLNRNRRNVPINGVWVWGGGGMHEPGDRLIVGDSPTNRQLAALLSCNVQAFPLADYPQSTIFLIEDPMNLSQLLVTLKHHAVHWYGQNGTYQTQSSWLKRVWSRLC